MFSGSGKGPFCVVATKTTAHRVFVIELTNNRAAPGEYNDLITPHSAYSQHLHQPDSDISSLPIGAANNIDAHVNFVGSISNRMSRETKAAFEL